MKLKFVLPDGSSKISNEFYVDSDDTEIMLDDFFDEFLGGSDKQPKDMFLNAKIESSEDIITVKWLKFPNNSQEIIDAVSDWFGQPIDNYINWT